MSDTTRTLTALQSILGDNVSGDVSPQDLRDFLVSVKASKQISVIDSATYNVGLDDEIVHVDYTATGACTVVLPPWLDHNGKCVDVVDSGGNAETNHIHLEVSGGGNIQTLSGIDITHDYNSLSLYVQSGTWYIY